MTIFSQMLRPTFSGKKAEPGLSVPTPLRGKALRRRQVMVKEAASLLPHLPTEPGTATHCLLTGRTDLMVILVEMLAHYGGECQCLRLATLSFNSRNTLEMAALLQSGRVGTLTLLCSSFFKVHNSAEYADAKSQAAAFPGRWTIAAARNHAKVACMNFGSRKIVTEGSANTRNNGSIENLAILMDEELHDWHSHWIDEQVRHGQQEEEDEEATRE